MIFQVCTCTIFVHVNALRDSFEEVNSLNRNYLFDLVTIELLAGLLNDGVLLCVIGMLLGRDFQDGRNDTNVSVDLWSQVSLGDLVRN